MGSDIDSLRLGGELWVGEALPPSFENQLGNHTFAPGFMPVHTHKKKIKKIQPHFKLLESAQSPTDKLSHFSRRPGPVLWAPTAAAATDSGADYHHTHDMIKSHFSRSGDGGCDPHYHLQPLVISCVHYKK